MTSRFLDLIRFIRTSMPHSKRHLTVLYDFLQVHGGAESVTLFLRDNFPESSVWVGSIDPAVFAPESLSRIFSLSPKTPWKNAALRAISTARSFESFGARLDARGPVMYSGHYAPLAVTSGAKGPNILYAHSTPLPFALDQHHEYLSRCTWWQHAPFRALCAWLRPRFENAIRQMDFVVANSQFVARHFATQYAIDTLVIHPPCRVDDLPWFEQNGYYLSYARLEHYKRVDRVIQAFKDLPDKRLLVGGSGAHLAELRALARDAPNIRFLGDLPRDRLREVLGHCVASIYIPKGEPFGISAVESLAAGKPVIGVHEGGLPEILVDGETGTLLPPDPTPKQIVEAVSEMTPSRAARMRLACEHRSSLFSSDIFLGRIRELLRPSWQ